MYEAKTKHRIDLKAEIQFLAKMFPAVTKAASKPYDITAEMKHIEKLYPRRYTPSTETTCSDTISTPSPSKSSIPTHKKLSYSDSTHLLFSPTSSISRILTPSTNALQYSPSSIMKTPVQTKTFSPPSTEPRYIPSSKEPIQEPVLKRRKARVSCFKQPNS